MAAEWIDQTGLVSARALHFAASLYFSGFWIFDRLLPGEIERGSAWRNSLRKANLLLLPCIAFSGIAWFLAVAQEMGGRLDLQTIRTVWEETSFGLIQHLRVALLCLALIPVWLAVRSEKKESIFRWAAFTVSGLLMATLAWAGHGGTGPHPFWHRTADVLHLLAAGAWPAGLVPLACVIKAKSLDASVLRRFSAMSLSAVLTLMITGIVNTVCLVGSWHSLLGTLYGRILIAKIALFLVMVALGAINLLRLSPRIERGAASTRLEFNVRLEVCLAMGIMGLVSLLGILPPTFFLP